MIDLAKMELWFATGSQHLYGNETLKTVAVHANEIAGELAKSKHIPLSIVPKPVLTTPDAITQLCTKANGVWLSCWTFRHQCAKTVCQTLT